MVEFLINPPSLKFFNVSKELTKIFPRTNALILQGEGKSFDFPFWDLTLEMGMTDGYQGLHHKRAVAFFFQTGIGEVFLGLFVFYW